MFPKGSGMSYRKEDWGYQPSDGEHVAAYAERLKGIAQQTRHDYTQNHLKWYTHYSSGPCFICNLMDMVDYCIEMLEMVDLADKKGKWSIVREKGTIGVLSFTLSRKPR